jgi:hypothetical protein
LSLRLLKLGGNPLVDENRHLIIVGHGPSLKGAGLGPEIDKFKWVVRLKNCSMLHGSLTDYRQGESEGVLGLPQEGEFC